MSFADEEKCMYKHDPPMEKRIMRERFLAEMRYNNVKLSSTVEKPVDEMQEGKSWDKYYFFSASTIRKHGQNRPSQEGPNTFAHMKKDIDSLMKSHSTKPKSMANQWTASDGSEYRDGYRIWADNPGWDPDLKEPSCNPHIFPDGHLTFNRIQANLERKNPPSRDVQAHLC